MNSLNKDNFDNFVLDNTILFYSFCSKFISDRAIAEDIVQDCYALLWESIDNMKDIKDAKLYMFSMVRNKAFNIIKRSKKIEYQDKLNINTYNDDDFSNDILEADVFSQLVSAIEQLKDNHSTIIKLSIGGLTNKEIAIKMDTTEDSIKSSKKRAIKKLKEILGNKITIILLLN